MAVPKVGPQDSSAENLRQRFLLSSNIVMLAVGYIISAYEKLKDIYNSVNSDQRRYFRYCSNSHLLFILSFISIASLAITITNWGGKSTPPLVVAVLSKRGNVLQRHILRNGWGMDLSSLERETQLKFILGDSECPINRNMRENPKSCKALLDYDEEKLLNWSNIDILNGTRRAEEKWGGSCVHGFGLRVRDDIVINLPIDDKLVPLENPKYFLKFADSQIEITDKILLPEGAEVEVIMTSDGNACDNLKRQSCYWRTGGSLEYTFVRFADGSTEPFSERFCTPFYVQFTREHDLVCGEGWSYYNGNCYYYSDSVGTYKVSEEKCQEMNSSLVSIQNEEENTFVNGFFRGSTRNSIWLGLKLNEDWRWSGVQDASFTNWNQFEPNNKFYDEFCSEMLKNSKWNDISCSSLNPIVCKKWAFVSRDSVTSESAKKDEGTWLKVLKLVDERVREESKAFGDIVLVNNLPDTYSSLPSKVKGLIKWTHENHPGAWLFKTDDDIHVNVHKLDDIISSYSDPNVHLSAPAVFSHFTKLRSVPYFGKNAEYAYSSLTYPPFPAGAGYLMTDSIVETLYEALPSLRSLQGEDVSVGVWLSTLTFKKLSPGLNLLDYKQVLGYGISIVKGLFGPILAQVSENRNLETVSVPQDEQKGPPLLITVPCWVGKQEGCKEGDMVVTEQSRDDIMNRFDEGY